MARSVSLGFALLQTSFNAALFIAVLRWHSISGIQAREADYDPSPSGRWARILAVGTLRWTALSLLVSIAGVIGIIKSNITLSRLFAFGSLLDWGTNALLIFTTLLLTYSPALSPSFSELLCHEFTRGELFGATSAWREREGRVGSTGWGLRGVEIVLWGIESCEENWRGVMGLGLLVALGALVVRGLGVWKAFEFVVELEREGGFEGQDEWFDKREAKRVAAEEDIGGRRHRRGSGLQRAYSVPTSSGKDYGSDKSTTVKRYKSHSMSTPKRPRPVTPLRHLLSCNCPTTPIASPPSSTSAICISPTSISDLPFSPHHRQSSRSARRLPDSPSSSHPRTSSQSPPRNSPPAYNEAVSTRPDPSLSEMVTATSMMGYRLHDLPVGSTWGVHEGRRE